MDINALIRKCSNLKINFTPKRKKLLEVLLKADRPISAYQIAEQYKQLFDETIPQMSVYRMLSLFVKYRLVHHITSSKKYVICSKSCCDHDDGSVTLLICGACSLVKEINVDNSLKLLASKQFFKLRNQPMELHGTCDKCDKSGSVVH